MITEKIVVYEKTGAFIETYLLSNSLQSQIGRKRPVMIVCPGGAYLRTSDQEAEQVALHYNTKGMHSVVLRYSCGDAARMPNPVVELAKTIQLLRKNAEEWFIDPNRIAAVGFSAGGHLITMLSTKLDQIAEIIGDEPENIALNAAVLGYPATIMDEKRDTIPPAPIGDYLIKPLDPEHPEDCVDPLFKNAVNIIDGQPCMDFSAAMYMAVFGTRQPTKEQLYDLTTVHFVNEKVPPTFVWTTHNDDTVPASNSIEYVRAMWNHGVPCEFHMFADGRHGLSLADDTVCCNKSMINPEVAAWFELSVTWLKKTGIITELEY